MKNPTIEAMAAKDAARWAAAEMFYGEGAGTARKLLNAELTPKYSMPGYYEAFCAAYDKLDLSKIAEKAIEKREKLDRTAKAGQNLRALKNGNIRGLSNGVFIVAGVLYVAHRTGYDKKALREAENLWLRAKDEYTSRKTARKARLLREEQYNKS